MEQKDTFRDLQFDGKPSGYRDFRRKTILAIAGLGEKHVYLAGPRLLQRLQGEAWRATEHLPIAELRQPQGWLHVISALDEHYRFLPETELHEAVEEFLFLLKRRPHEGATSFTSRFKTQLDRVQTLISQERDASRKKKKGGKSSSKGIGSEKGKDDSSLEDSDAPPTEPSPENTASGTDTEQHAAGSPVAGGSQAGEGGSQHAEGQGSKPPSSLGGQSKRKSETGSKGTHRADQAKAQKDMLRMLGTLEHGHLKPKPILPQSILGHLYMRKFGLNREQRAQIIRATNGSSRLVDVERILRASDLEEFRSEERRRHDERRPAKVMRKDTYAVQDSEHHVAAVDGGADSSSSLGVLDSDSEPQSEEAHVVGDDGDTDQELHEAFEIQKRAKKEFRKNFKTYKETKKKVREIKKNRTPYLPVVALGPDQPSGPSNQQGPVRQSFGYDKKPSGGNRGFPKRKPDGRQSRKEEASLVQTSLITEFSYMVSATSCDVVPEEILLTSIPAGYAVIDTGCTTSIVGSETADQLKNHLRVLGWPQPEECSLPPVELKGFNGGIEETTKGLKWSVRIGTLWGTITTYVTDGQAPFLLSRRVLEAMGAVLNLAALTFTSIKHGMQEVPLRQATNGHILLPLLEPQVEYAVIVDDGSEPPSEEYHEPDPMLPAPASQSLPIDPPVSCQTEEKSMKNPTASSRDRSVNQRVSSTDRRRAMQHIVKNTRKGIVNVDRFRDELKQIFGYRGSLIDHAFVAYQPRLERIPQEAGVSTYHKSVAMLHEGNFWVDPWTTRYPGAERKPVQHVNSALFVYCGTEPQELEHSPGAIDNRQHLCYCCGDCDSEGGEVTSESEDLAIDRSITTEVLFSDDTDWVDVETQDLKEEHLKFLMKNLKGLRHSHSQFVMSRLALGKSQVKTELKQWLGKQAHLLDRKVSLVEVFTGKAPLADAVEKCGVGQCIRIGLDYGQDLNRLHDRRMLILLVAFLKPLDVWISFPCGCWGPWSRFNMQKNEKLREQVQADRQTARKHLSVVSELWTLQHLLGNHVHLENPLTSDAWKELKFPHAYIVRIDQCSLGLRCPKTNLPVLKPTRIVTSCTRLAKALSVFRCDGKHQHAHLEGNYKGRPLTSYAETYPRKFCRIVSGVLCHEARQVKPAEADVFADLELDLEREEGEDEPEEDPEHHRPLNRKRIEAMIRKLHINTGHSSPEQMIRLANRCEVTDEVKDVIRKFRCPVCEELKVPPSRRQVAMPHAESPNHIVGVDFVQVELKHVNDQGSTVEQKYQVLTCVDLATDFAQQIIVEKGSNQLSKAFHEIWTRPFGAPKVIYSDPSSSTLSADFQAYLVHNGISLLHCGTEAHWQLGRVETANRILRNMAQRVWQTTSRPAAEVIETCASVRNQQLRKHGYSPSQWFLGQDSKHPAMMTDIEEQGNYPVQSQVLACPSFHAKVLLREEACRAFVEEHARDTWRRALAGRNRPMRGPYQAGQLVYFFRKRARGLLSTRHGVWYGPGKVIGLESSSQGVIPRVVWVAFNGFLYKCAPEGLRPVPEDESQFRELAKQLSMGRLDPQLEQAEQSLSQRAPQYQDLTKELPTVDDEELKTDLEAEPDNDDDLISNFDAEEGPRKVRRRFYRSTEYWQKRTRGEPPLGSLQEGLVPNRVTLEDLSLEPATKRRTLEPVPEREDEEMSLASDCAPTSNQGVPPDNLMEDLDPIVDQPMPESADPEQDVEMPDVPETDTTLAQPSESPPAEPFVDPDLAVSVPVPEDDEGLMVETGNGRIKRQESVLEVSFNVTSEDITADPLCLWHVLDECLQITTSKAKLRRVEVSYRKLNPTDQGLFKQAMQKEWQSWVDNRVTSLCKSRGIDPDRIIKARWVLTWKKSSDPDDRSKTPKARLVLIGWQDPELGKIATDSPTLRKESKHLILSLCAAEKWRVFGADIKTAFLSGDKSERDIYFKPPTELKEWLGLDGEDLFRLEKAAYGLAEAPRAWYLRLSREMKEAGLTQSQLDPCLFTLRIKGNLAGVCGIHVDDLLGGGTPAMDKILAELRKRLPFGDFRTFTIRYTGIEVRQCPKTFEVEVGQEAYIDGLEEVMTKPLGSAGTPLKDKSLLRTCAGQLAWVANATRPDCAFLSSYLQGVQDKGSVSHVQLYNKCIRELKTKKVCLKFPSTVPVSNWRICCIADAGWATRHNGDSQGGYLLLLAESAILDRKPAKCWLIDWASKKLKRAVRSSVAAETLAGQNGLDAIEMFQAVLLETIKGITPKEFRDSSPPAPAGIVVDSKGFYDAITRSCSSQSVSLERRLLIDYAIAKETLSKQNIYPYWVNNLRMAADCLTKLKGDVKLLHDLLESNRYHIQVCKESGRKEKANQGAE